MIDQPSAEMIFTDKEWLRYTRHIQLPQIGSQGQIKLKQSKVLIVGAGGLGSPVALYLAAAGVGYITIVDGDVVDLTNLQRQIIFSTEQVGKSKAQCAKNRLLALNPEITVEAIEQHFSTDNASQLVSTVDMVVDCTDNFSTRYLINDVCLQLKKPWLFASIFQFSGQCALFTPDSACFRCLFPEAPVNAPDCNAAGVLGVLPGILGTLQSNEVLKYLAGLSCELENKLLIVEALNLEFTKIQLAKSPTCACVNPSTISLQAVTEYCDNNTSEESIGFSQVKSEMIDDKAILLDVRDDVERRAFHIGGLHIPLDELPQRLRELSSKQMIFCYCQTGIRSEKAALLLRQAGFSANNIEGGLMRCLQIAVNKG